MAVIRSIDVACPVCNQGPGEPCLYTTIDTRLGQPMRGIHGRRQEDAQLAQKTANALLGI